MATDINTLLAEATSLLREARCYACVTNPQTLTLIQLALLKQIALAVNPNAVTDVATLLADSETKCYRCLTEQQLQVLSLALLKLIVDQGGISGNPVTSGVGEPVDPPVGDVAVYVDTSTGRVWWYFNGVWQ